MAASCTVAHLSMYGLTGGVLCMAHHLSQYFQLEPVSCFLVLTARAIVMRVYILVILSANDLVSSTIRDSGPVSEMTMSLAWYEGRHHHCLLCERFLPLGTFSNHVIDTHGLSMILYRFVFFFGLCIFDDKLKIYKTYTTLYNSKTYTKYFLLGFLKGEI